jgi:hypothetical protein
MCEVLLDAVAYLNHIMRRHSYSSGIEEKCSAIKAKFQFGLHSMHRDEALSV